jgi:hypothetical protein
MRILRPFAFLLLFAGSPLAAQAPSEEAPVTVLVPLDEARTLDRVGSAFIQAGLDLSAPTGYGDIVGIGFDRDSSAIDYVARIEGRGDTSLVKLSATPRRPTADRKSLRIRLEALAAAISGGT